MAHSHKHLREMHPGRDRAKKMVEHHARGGAAKHSDEAEDKAIVKKMVKGDALKAHGKKSGGRMDKYARGGKVKHGGGKHHTKINIMVNPKAGGADVPPPPMGAGAPPPGPPMPPPGGAPMGPPPGGPMGGGMPGMKRGGGVQPKSGIANPGNLKKWSEYAGQNTRYADGGVVGQGIAGVGAGAGTAVGRMRKAKAYGSNARKNGPI